MTHRRHQGVTILIIRHRKSDDRLAKLPENNQITGAAFLQFMP
jgi:hypothetical protein